MHQPAFHAADEDLLLAFEGELAPDKQAALEAHLAQCVGCRERRATLAHTEAVAMGICRESEPLTDSIERGRERLSRRMADDSRRWRHTWTQAVFPSANVAPRWAFAALILAAGVLYATVRYDALLLKRSMSVQEVEHDARPSSALTPGAVRRVSLAELCSGTLDPRQRVSEAVRQEVLRNYGMTNVPADEYELDFLVTPELGGVAEARNLWPERYAERRWNAHVKDALENLLAQLVCSGKIDLATAQRDIAEDWVSAYKKYLQTDRPLIMHARLSDKDDEVLWSFLDVRSE